MVTGLWAAGSGCTISNQITSEAKVSGLCTAKGSLSIPVEYRSIAPVMILGVAALVVLVLAATLPKRRYPGLWAALATLAGTGVAIDGVVQWVNLNNTANTALTVGGQVLYDHFSAFFAILIGCATALGALVADGYLTREALDGPEPYVLMLLSSAGGVLMAEAAGLITLFLGLEVLSISLYTLTAYHHRRAASGEAGLKYFILGSFSSAVFIYGVALTYGATGSTQYFEIFHFLTGTAVVHDGILLAGMALLIAGLGFKVAAVPFHFWTPDVYQGAPAPFVGYMAAVAKAAGFAGLLRVLMLALPTEVSVWRPAIWVLATASVLVGSVLALVQSDLKRMLAYSTISQAGYVLIALQAGTQQGWSAAAFYLFTYTFMVVGTFAVISVVQGRGEARNDLGSIRGLAMRSPWLAGSMLVLLLAQAGVPLTSGFLGKWVVISAVIGKGQYELALIGMLGAAVAAFIYLRIALLMYMPPTEVAAGEEVQAVPGASGQGQMAAGGDALSVQPAGGTAVGDLLAMATAGLAAAGTVVTLRAPSAARLRVPRATAAVLAVCVAFTIFAGVSTPVLSLAHSIGLTWAP
ncbi:MAG: NADH-quinone oxidoreductase subunit N [Acidimicrobiales bacterium]